MKIERLSLDCYGHFKERDFDLSGDDVRLHIVHGPNEAGKSTTLSAIGDFLFGFPRSTPYKFRYGNDPLAVSGTLVSRGGARLSFQRRKKNDGKILVRTGGGEVLEDAARTLPPFLGDAGRDVFERMFGLDHARLRQGGRAMLEDGGDLARLLFEAGSGLSGAMRLLDALEAEADAIASLGRQAKSRRLNQALESFKEAQDRLKAEGRSEQEWHQAQKDAAAARAIGDEVAGILSDVRARRHRIHRLLRVLPALAALDGVLVARAALGTVPDLPEGFEDDWRAAATAATGAADALARAQTAWDGLAVELAGCGDPGPLPALAEEIRRLHQMGGAIAGSRREKPVIHQEWKAGQEHLAALVQALGLPVPVDGIGPRIPSAPLTAGVRERMERRKDLATAQAAARRRHEEATARAAASAAALAEAATAADPADAAAALDEAARLGDTAEALAAARQRQSLAAAAVDQALARLDLWTMGLDALAAAPFPDAETVAERERERAALDDAHTRKESGRDEAAALHDRLAADLAEIEAAGSVPTPDAVMEARRERDRLWRALRTAPGDPALPARYEEAVAAADSLADRREREANRIARFATLSRQRLEARMKRDAAETERAAIAARTAAWDRAWNGLWAPAGLIPAAPGAMARWLGRKDAVLRLADAARLAGAEAAGAAERHDRAASHRRAAALALGLPADSSAAVLRAAVDTATKRRGALDTLRRDHQAHEREVGAAERDMGAADAALQKWEREWAQAMPALGLPAGATVAEAAAALALWDDIRAAVTRQQDRHRRLDALEAEDEAFAAAVTALVAQAAPALDDLAGRDGLEIMAEAVRRLEAAQTRDTHRRQVDKRAGDAKTALDAAAVTARDAAQALDSLRARHGLGPDDDAVTLARAAAAVRTAERDIVRCRAALAEAGGGQPEEELRREAAGLDPDTLNAQALDLDEEEKRLLHRKDEATRTQALTDQRLHTLRSARGGGEAEWQARDAARAMGEHARHWMRLRAASLLLAQAVERYRATNQQPLLTRASGLLAAIAAGSGNPITGLEPDYGKNNRPVLQARRADGTTCLVDGMSEGTRDQLFLALRIAAIEQYAAEKEPLPFIADDLFITSDDQRTVPGLHALAELGAHTQVVLFTHHRSVLDTAAACLPAGAVRVHRL
ncbi:uncharacterized protein YhaN [Azospirillum fermentarium]|uniref:YhaN family protein n=1 Tax=Azospirillum fermentarium TaxID=1233114 RepID=UPI002226D9A4|nr:YhaN family protein [Azospirillum fermentarium]MCW2248011.1 uncharacterized protein YhaN [Azospirillum fermentarium]